MSDQIAIPKTVEEITSEQCTNILNQMEDVPLSFEYSQEPFSAETIGFLGDHHKLTINATYEDNVVQDHEFFVKTVPTKNKIFQDYVQECGMFPKEISFYQDIIPLISKYIKGDLNSENKETDPEPFAPTCYLVATDFIVLENVKRVGFRTHDGYFGAQQWETLLVTLARFHSCSLVYEETMSSPLQQYRLNEQFKDTFKEMTFMFDVHHPRGKWLRNCLRAIIDLFQLYPNCPNKIEVTSKLLKYIFIKLPEFVEPSTKFRNVACHGDLWQNNILFGIGKESRKLALLIDFQLTRYAPPVLDLLTAMYLNCEKSYLDGNFDAIINNYYTLFSQFLDLNKIEQKPETYTKEKFLESINEYKMPAIIESLFFGTIIFISPELSTRMLENSSVFTDFTYEDRSKYVIREYHDNANFKERMDGLFSMLVDIAEKLEV